MRVANELHKEKLMTKQVDGKSIDWIDTRGYREFISETNKDLKLGASKIESYVGLILKDYKSSVWRGVRLNYSDIIINYLDYAEPDKNKKAKEMYLRASISHHTFENIKGVMTKINRPNFLNWLDELDEIFIPLKIFIDERKKSYYG